MGYGDVLDKSKVSWRRAHEHNCVLSTETILARNDEARDVEGPEVHPLARVRSKVTGSTWESRALGRKVDDQMAVHQHSELPDSIIAVINVEALEG